jgi:integral membrane sensor domain MASE1
VLRRVISVAILVAVGYYLTAWLGFAFALQPGSVSTLWMPNSILLAGLLLVPRRYWWIIVVAACPAHFAAEIQSHVPLALVVPLFVSNSFQAIFGAFFICIFVDDGLRFEKLRDLTVFLFFGAFLAPFLASFLDVAVVRQNDLVGRQNSVAALLAAAVSANNPASIPRPVLSANSVVGLFPSPTHIRRQQFSGDRQRSFPSDPACFAVAV